MEENIRKGFRVSTSKQKHFTKCSKQNKVQKKNLLVRVPSSNLVPADRATGEEKQFIKL